MKKSTKQTKTARSLTTEQLANIVGGANPFEGMKLGLSPGDVVTFAGAAAAQAGSLGGLL